MRHFSTLLAAILVAPLSWLLLAAGQDRSASAFAGPLAAGDLIRPALCLAGAGLLLGLLATLRISPLGAALAGAAYSASYLAVLADPQGVLGAVPQRLSVAGHRVDLIMPLRTGTALLLGALLLVATVSAGRWRRPAPARPGPARPVPAGARALGDRPAGEEAAHGPGDRREAGHTAPALIGGPAPAGRAEPAGEPGRDGGRDREGGPGWDGGSEGGSGPEWDDSEWASQERAGLHRAERGRSRTGNRGPGPYDRVNNSGDRWVGNKQPVWPYPEQPRAGSGTFWD
jgi:hypothetical protein